jgi:hypothetical protein
VSTFLKIDDKWASDATAAKVDGVEDALGRPARSERADDG